MGRPGGDRGGGGNLTGARTKLQPVRQAAAALTLSLRFVPVRGWCPGDVSASGTGAPRRPETSRWVPVGPTSTGMPVRVPRSGPGCGPEWPVRSQNYVTASELRPAGFCPWLQPGGNVAQSAAGQPRPTPGGHQQPVAAQLPAVAEDQHVIFAVAPRGHGLDAQGQLDAVTPQLRTERLAQRYGLAGQHVRGRLDQRHLTAQPPHDLGDLGADRAAAENEQPTRDGLHPGRLPVGPHPLQLAQARDRRQHRIPSRWPAPRALRCTAVRQPRPRPARPACQCRGSGRCPCPPARPAARRQSNWRP